MGIFSRFRETLREDKREARAPAGVRLYAVGDIHGRDDLLQSLAALIANDEESDANAR